MSRVRAMLEAVSKMAMVAKALPMRVCRACGPLGFALSAAQALASRHSRQGGFVARLAYALRPFDAARAAPAQPVAQKRGSWLFLRPLLITCGLPLIAVACAVTPPTEDPVLVKLSELEKRLAAIERVLASGSLVELTVQTDELQRRTNALQGRTETLEHEAAGATARQRELYADLDMRIQNLERMSRGTTGSANVLDGGALAPGQLPVPDGSDRDNYQAAFELLKEQRYEPAAMAFQQFLVTFPDSQLADNAQYWLAESHYVTQKYDVALREFKKVIGTYPTSRKVPDALLKVGYCNYELKRYGDARQALAQVQSDYPDTTAARLAEQRLKRMDGDGQ